MAKTAIVESALTSSLIKSGYVFDYITSVWQRPNGAGRLNYNDGDEVEERIYNAVLKSLDVRAGSSDLAAQILDWPMLYHLSPARSNLLRPISHLLGGDTLEIGAGCGALSRYVGELGGRLVAVEGSLRRATIAAARCRSLENTEIVCDTLDGFNPDQHFDAVLLVGVLEYCRLFSEAASPEAMLAACRRFLKPGGCLIVAIENQLGLKYWCGAPEDHLGEAYIGIEGRYGPSTAATWGRQELTDKLKLAGLPKIQELYPFPDYKLPQLVLTQSALDYGSVLADLLSQYGPTVQNGHAFIRVFSEAAALRTAARNSLVNELANSFLMVASRHGLPEVEGAFVYSTARCRAFQRETHIARTDGEFRTRKTPLYDDCQPASAKFRWSPSNEPFRQGRVYFTLLEEIASRPDWSYDQIVEWARLYYEFLLSKVIGSDSEGETAFLPGDYLDCGPHNLVVTAELTLETFDSEWVSQYQLPLDFVFFRSILYSLNRLSAVAPIRGDDGIVSGVRQIMGAFGLRTDDETLEKHFRMESEFQSFVSGRVTEISLQQWRIQKLKQKLPSAAEILRNKEQIIQLQHDVEKERSMRDQLAAAIAELERMVSAAVAVEHETKQNVEHLQRVSADANSKTLELENRLIQQQLIQAGLEKSLSWKVTLPLRMVASIARSLLSSRTVPGSSALREQ